METALLHIPVENDGGWMGGCVVAPNLSGGYHGLLFTWLERVPKKSILLTGEGTESEDVKSIFRKRFPDIEDIKTSSLGEGDIPWDMTVRQDVGKWDVIISQATLEHVIDPAACMVNMCLSLAPGGHLLVHTVGPKFGFHRYPVDCCRFFPDFFFGSIELLMRENVLCWVVDYYDDRNHIFFNIRREG